MDIALVAACSYHGSCFYYTAYSGFATKYTAAGARQLAVHVPALMMSTAVLPAAATYWSRDGLHYNVVPWTLLFLLVADAAMYWFHRACHRYPPLRRLHGAHHVHKSTICWSTGVVHPCEAVAMSACLMAGPALLPRAPVAAVYCTVALFVLLQVQEHEGQTATKRSCGLVDHQFHRAHHQRMTGNYAFVFCLWDVAFGTELAGRRSDTSPTSS